MSTNRPLTLPMILALEALAEGRTAPCTASTIRALHGRGLLLPPTADRYSMPTLTADGLAALEANRGSTLAAAEARAAAMSEAAAELEGLEADRAEADRRDAGAPADAPGLTDTERALSDAEAATMAREAAAERLALRGRLVAAGRAAEVAALDAEGTAAELEAARRADAESAGILAEAEAADDDAEALAAEVPEVDAPADGRTPARQLVDAVRDACHAAAAADGWRSHARAAESDPHANLSADACRTLAGRAESRYREADARTWTLVGQLDTYAPPAERRAPGMVLELTAGYTPNGNRRVCAVILSALGHELAVTHHYPARDVAARLDIGCHAVTVPPAEVRDYVSRAERSGRLLPIGAGLTILEAFAAALENGDRVTAERLAAL